MTTSTKSECQLCEAHFCTKNGMLVKHGYKRPGDGYLHGQCGGSHRAPFSATDALVQYRDLIATMASDANAWQSQLLAGQVNHAVVEDTTAKGFYAIRDRALRPTRDLFVGVSDASDLAAAFRSMNWAADQKCRWMRAELARVERRLIKAAALNAKQAA